MSLSVRAAAAWLLCCFAIALPAFGEQNADAAPPDRVELKSGDVLLGTITEQNAQQIVLEHPVLGTLTLDRDDVAPPTETAPEAEPEPEGEPEAEPAPETAPEPEAEPAAESAPAAEAEPAVAEAIDDDEPAPTFLENVRGVLEDWNVQIALGFADRASNVKSFSFHTRLNASYADEKDRWRINAGYHRATTDSTTTRDDVRVFLQKDWLLPDSSFFFFGQTEYDYDTIKAWDHRFGAHGGLGYDLNELLGVDARLRGGFGFTREFGGVDPKTRPESLLASEISLKLTDTHAVAGSVQYMPSIDGSGYYRITSDANWDITLTEELSLRFGIEHEYDNAVPAGYKKHDRRLTGSLVFKF